MLKTLGAGQEQLRLEMRQDSVNLRQQLKLELKEEVQALFDSFDRNWISRFEQIMIESSATQGPPALPSAGRAATLPATSSMAALEYVDSITEQQPSPCEPCPSF